MALFFNLIGKILGWIWGLPMILLLGSGGVFITIWLKFRGNDKLYCSCGKVARAREEEEKRSKN